MEVIRRQLYDLRTIIKDKEGIEQVTDRIEQLDNQIIEIEGELTQLKFTGTGQDFIRWPWKLIGKLKYLASTVETADFGPTDQQREVYQVLKEKLEETQKRYEEFKKSELPAFVDLLEQQNLNAGVIVPGP